MAAMNESEVKVRKRKHSDEDLQDSDNPGHSQHLSNRWNLHVIKERADAIRHNVLEEVKTQIERLVDDLVEDIEKINFSSGDNSVLTESRISKENGKSRELLAVSHIRTIYHIFVAILIVFSLNTLVSDFAEQNRLVLDFDLITWAFGQFPLVLWIWGCMMLSTTVLFYCMYSFWSSSRRGKHPNWFDWLSLGAYICYQTVFIIWPLRIVVEERLPPASALIVACEQTRLVMKSHAFFRENVCKILNFYKDRGQDSSEMNDNPFPGFSKYLYFLFAPTLVYRDNYPRTPAIRWNYVVSNFTQVVACMFYTYYIFARFCVPVFRNFSTDYVSPTALILSAFGCMLPGTLVLFIAFFAILHSWLNAFAEMLRFGDRQFYKDWWNSANFASYYRTWNVVVHDWLFAYLYKDVHAAVGPTLRPLSMASVFLLSAVFHEYILSVSLGFFYPVLFVMFMGCGFAFVFVRPNKHALGNVVMWVMLMMGTGLLMCLYSLEWYARLNCDAHENPWLDVLIPRSWTCVNPES